MTPAKFVDDYLEVGDDLRCPLIQFRERCQAAGLTTREVLAEIRGRYGNGCRNPNNRVASPWMRECRMTMPDGSRPRAFSGFAFKDAERRLPPTVAILWPHLPYRGLVNDFPIDVNVHQLAGACKSGRVAMVRRKDKIWIVRDIDPDFDVVWDLGKDRRAARIDREERRERWNYYVDVFPHPN